MLDVSHLPYDFCIGSYISRDQDSNDDFPYDSYTGFVLDIKAGNRKVIQDAVELLADCLTGFDAVTVVPSHCSNQVQSAGIQQVGVSLANQTLAIDAIGCLRRHTTTQKRTGKGSNRSESEHTKSIKLHNADLIRDKRVLLIDDVRTTGNSLKVCQDILHNASPSSVHSIAFAQSIGPSGCDPEENYEHIEIAIRLECRRQMEAFCELTNGDEHSVTNYLKCVDDIEINADIQLKALDKLKAFAGFYL